MYNPGEKVINKTIKYLSQKLLNLPLQITSLLQEQVILGMGIQDLQFSTEYGLYIVFDKNGRYTCGEYVDSRKANLRFAIFIEEIRKSPLYVIDYPYSINSPLSNQVVVVLKLDDDIISSFLSGRYSKLYSEKEIIKIPKFIMSGKAKVPNVIYQVLTKDAAYKPAFVAKLNAEFGTSIKVTDINDNRELETPPNLKHECLLRGTTKEN